MARLEEGQVRMWRWLEPHRAMGLGGRTPGQALVDEPYEWHLPRTDVSVVHDPEAGVVHLGDGPAGAADGLDISDVAPPTLPGDHDRAHRGCVPDGEAVCLGVAVPRVGVAHPWDVPARRHVPGAVAPREVAAAAAGEAGDAEWRRPSRAAWSWRRRRRLLGPRVTGAVGDHQLRSRLQRVGIVDQVEVDDRARRHAVLGCQGAESVAVLGGKQDAVDGRYQQRLSQAQGIDVGHVVGPTDGVDGEAELVSD